MGFIGHSEARPLLSRDRGQILPPEFRKIDPPWEEYPLFEEFQGVPSRIFASPNFAGAFDHTFSTIPRDNFLKARGQYARPKGEEGVLRMHIRKSWIESRTEAQMLIDALIRPEEDIPEGTSRKDAFLTILQNSFHHPGSIGITLPVDNVPPEMLEIFDKEKKQWLPVTQYFQ